MKKPPFDAGLYRSLKVVLFAGDHSNFSYIEPEFFCDGRTPIYFLYVFEK